ncbi:MAG TPA: glycosyltransferase [Thermoplasmata archaeon]|nr:glycosyltransferase [Thermoplasmata archaeon]
MRSAIIVTVLNEMQHIRGLLTSLETQTRTPDVIVITDGGSTDETQEILREFASDTRLRFQWQVVPGNRSQGRNAAIRTADAELLAVTDVNVLESDWFERIIGPLERGEADIVGGWYEPIAETPRERAMGAMTLFSLEEIKPDAFVPASRSVAFTREAWHRVGGYNERLAMAEDTALVLAMRRAGLRFVFEPRAIVRCWTAADLREAFGMYRRYAFSDGQAAHFGVPQTRYGRVYAIYAGGAVLLILGFGWPLLWLLLVAGAFAYALLRARKVLRRRWWAQVPYSILVGLAIDFAQMSGYAAGRAHAVEASPDTAGARGPSKDR